MTKRSTILLAALILICSNVSWAQMKERKVLFIGIDGVRSDALDQANTPNMDSLFDNGVYTYDSWHLGVTSSGPSWSTMLTGVWEAKHKITNNSYSGANFGQYPYFPTRAKEINPNLKAVQIITWNPMDDADKNTGGNVFNAGWDRSIDAGNLGQGLVTAAAKIQLLDPDIDILFIHYDETDAAGHGFGFSPNVPQYMNAIQTADAEIGEVMKALRARPTFAQEEWLVLGTTDHGGSGTGHGGNSNNERHIWWFASAAPLPTLEITGSDPGSYQMPNNPVDPQVLANTPVQADIAVTALDWILPTIKADTVQAWDLDGQSWLPDSLSVVMTTSVDKDLLPGLQVYPNPASEFLSIRLPAVGKKLQLELTAITGKVLKQKQIMAMGEANIRMSIKELTAGMYFLKVSETVSGQQLALRKVQVLN